MKKRTIFIGDIHGCFSELKELLLKLAVRPEDDLISLGDIICKGPDSKGVLDWAIKTKNLRCIIGNHELRYLLYWKEGLLPDQKPYDLKTVLQLGNQFGRYMRFLDSLPVAILGRGWRAVHAGFDPRYPFEGQSKWELTNIRRLADTKKPWYESYKGRELIVFGHWVRREVLQRKNAVCLDTGCVYGGKLSALVWPENKIVSVPARRVYRYKESWL